MCVPALVCVSCVYVSVYLCDSTNIYIYIYIYGGGLSYAYTYPAHLLKPRATQGLVLTEFNWFFFVSIPRLKGLV